jgi:hypothetical protein
MAPGVDERDTDGAVGDRAPTGAPSGRLEADHRGGDPYGGADVDAVSEVAHERSGDQRFLPRGCVRPHDGPMAGGELGALRVRRGGDEEGEQ